MKSQISPTSIEIIFEGNRYIIEPHYYWVAFGNSNKICWIVTSATDTIDVEALDKLQDIIDLYEANDGYAGLTLKEFMIKILPDVNRY